MVKILKLFALVITIFISSYAKSYSEIVKKVTIEGNQRISKATIIIYGDIKIGSDYETKDINLLIKKLYETKFFSNISVELDSNILNIQVEENPIVNQIIFNGEKVKKFKETLAKILTLREKTSFIKSYVK